MNFVDANVMSRIATEMAVDDITMEDAEGN